MRQVTLDTETTGLEVRQGHRIIEIGCVELVDRRLTGRTWHQYIQPQREIDAGAAEVHGITNEMLADKPLFAAVADEFLAFIEGAELLIHNAPFDLGFLNQEMKLLDSAQPIDKRCKVVDTLLEARHKHPGQQNSLDALCKRYQVDSSARDLHGALLDAQLLAQVYLAMTCGPTYLALDGDEAAPGGMEVPGSHGFTPIERNGLNLRVTTVSEAEEQSHQAYLQRLAAESGDTVWAAEAGASP
ncbi:MAG: DNA polymerase III subunit epsilon [Cellvibrionales bacterium]|nr:DNA polymerase III subunit epsilon [Cellvibrionales bacterium]